MKNLLKVVFVFALAAGLTACQKNVKDDANADLTAGTTPAGTEMVIEETNNTVQEESTVPTQEIALGAVYFSLDKSTLSSDARKIVEANAQAIKSAAALAPTRVIIEGNCDDRGTTSYNIALGQKRAEELKANYVRLGVNEANIETVSYGKEKPVCVEATQECWAKNRRADTLLSVK